MELATHGKNSKNAFYLTRGHIPTKVYVGMCDDMAVGGRESSKIKTKQIQKKQHEDKIGSLGNCKN